MFQITLTISVNSEISKVWDLLTTSDGYGKWMPNITAVSDWQEGSKIVYTCYNPDGSVMLWKGHGECIWDGSIEKLILNQEFSCKYPGSHTGLIEESYLFEAIDENNTKVTLIQDLTTQEVADEYKKGSMYSLELLKTYLAK